MHQFEMSTDIYIYVCVCVCDQDMLDVFGRITEVAIYSHSAIPLQSVVVLAPPILGLVVTG